VQDGDQLVIRREGEIFREIPLDAWGQSMEVNWFEGWKCSALTEHYSIREILWHADALGQAAVAKDEQEVQAELKVVLAL
jgi:hypothetical protein